MDVQGIAKNSCEIPPANRNTFHFLWIGANTVTWAGFEYGNIESKALKMVGWNKLQSLSLTSLSSSLIINDESGKNWGTSYNRH